MRIVCPECHAAYQVGAIIKNAILVCHRCNTEFDTYGNKIVEGNETAEVFKKQEEHAPTFGVKDLIQSGMAGKKEQVWLWMILILLALTFAGIAMQWQHWKFNSMARAVSIETNNDAPVLDRDWKIIANTVQSQWLKREDGSLVLVIEGQVQNLVGTTLPPPEIKVTFITQIGENIEFVLPITEPADLKTLQSVPFMSPAIDKTPVSMLGTRGFLLLIEDAPQATQHMLLHAIATQRKSTTPL